MSWFASQQLSATRWPISSSDWSFTRIQSRRINLCELTYVQLDLQIWFLLNFFSKFLTTSTTLLACLYLPLLNVQLLLLFNPNSNLIIALVVTSLLAAISKLSDKCWKLLLDAFTVAQSMLLLYLSISYDDENFWLISMPILIALNYFTIPQLASHYSVPKQELLSISLIFQNIFLTNAFF